MNNTPNSPQTAMEPPSTPRPLGSTDIFAASSPHVFVRGPRTQAELDADWEFSDAPKWFDLTRLGEQGYDYFDNPPAREDQPLDGAAALSTNVKQEVATPAKAPVPGTPARSMKSPSTPGNNPLATPGSIHVIAAFAETPSITKYFVKQTDDLSEKPMEFISFGPEYSNDQIADCLLPEFSDGDGGDSEQGSDSADSLTDYSDSDFVDTDEVVVDPIAALSTPSKSTIRSTFSRFATPSRSTRKSMNVRKTPARRPSAVFLVYPDPDALGAMAHLTPIRGRPHSPPPQNDAAAAATQQDLTTPAPLSSSNTPAVTDPPATPSAATSFHWAQSPTSTVPVFPKIATTETILYSVRKPAKDVIDVDSGSDSDHEDVDDDDEKAMQADQGSSASASFATAGGSKVRSVSKVKKQKDSIATRLTKPKEFSFMKRQRAPLRVVSSPAIRRHKAIKIQRPLRATIMAPTVASSNKSHAIMRAAMPPARQPRIRELQHRPPGVTIPQSPMLRTKHLRKLPLATMSAAEREELLVQQMKKEQFKARPLDRKIFQTDHPLGVPERKPFQPTAPHSPAITKVKPKRPSPPSPTPVVSSKPAKMDGKQKHVEPFHLPGEAFTASKRQELEKRLQREEEELQKKREFCAQPLPRAVVVPKPIVPEVHSTKPLTEPKPFSLRTDARVGTAHHSPPTTATIPEFRARPVPSTTYTEFQVTHSDKPPTMPDLAPHLHTEDRAEVRRDFEERLAQRRALEELQAQREAEDRERELKKFIRELRRDLVHKARDAPAEILQGPTFVPQPSARPPTVPESPAIGKKRKAAMVVRVEEDHEEEERKRARWGWSVTAPEFLEAPQMVGEEHVASDNVFVGKGKGKRVLDGHDAVAPVDQTGDGEDELDMTMWTLPQEDAEWLLGGSSAADR